MAELAYFGGKPAVGQTWPLWPIAGARERHLVEEVLSSTLWGGTGMGPKIRALNANFAAYCGAKAGAAVANGTVSMELCLRAWGIGAGDEVIVPAWTFFATAVAVHSAGAPAVYVDVDPATLNLNPARVEEAITERTRAIIPVHFAGHPADMDAINALAAPRGIKVLEDAAQAHGASYKGRMVGSLADAAPISLPHSKNMQGGEGGIVTSDDQELIDVIHYSLGKFGRGVRERYSGHVHYRHGINACFTEIQAAIVLAQLERLEEQTETRAVNALRLIEALDGVEGLEAYPWEPYCTRHGHHLFTMRFNSEAFGASRGQFLAAMHAEGVPAIALYPMPLYDQPLYQGSEGLAMRQAGECPVAEAATRETVGMEQHILLAEREQVLLVADAVRKVRGNVDAVRKIEVEEGAFVGSAVLTRARAAAMAEVE